MYRFLAIGPPFYVPYPNFRTGNIIGGQVIAELFRADGRYGVNGAEKTVDAEAGGMVMDSAGRLFVSSRFGVQVFSDTGDLLGVINFPVPIGFTPKQPRSCTLGGPDGSSLYVACDDEVYVVPLQPGRVARTEVSVGRQRPMRRTGDGG